LNVENRKNNFGKKFVGLEPKKKNHEFTINENMRGTKKKHNLNH
jgi:hypothetical protein